jgi:hypothetical protein
MKNKYYIGLVALYSIVIVLIFAGAAVYSALNSNLSNAIYFSVATVFMGVTLRKDTVTRLKLFWRYPDEEDEETLKQVSLSKEQLIFLTIVSALVAVATVIYTLVDQRPKLYFVKGQVPIYFVVQAVYQFLIRPAAVNIKNNYIGKSVYYSLRNQRQERFERVQAILTWLGILFIPFLVGIGYGQNPLDAFVSGFVLSSVTVVVIAIGWTIYFSI